MKKIHPLVIINNSNAILSSNENLQHLDHLSCRFCNVTDKGNFEEDQLIYPCTCPMPIHRNCVFIEMRKSHLGPTRHDLDKKQQMYNCKRCSEVIRFRSTKELKCRNCEEVHQFRKNNCCVCTILAILAFITLIMVILIIVILKFNFYQDKMISDATIIGISIGAGVLLLIVLYFFISDVLLKNSYQIKLLERRSSPKRKHIKNNSISIINCQ